MSAIGPGDFVECVRDSISAPGTFVVGAIYRALDITPEGGLEIDGVPAGDDWSGWDPSLFRPIYRPKRSLIEQLKRPVSEPA